MKKRKFSIYAVLLFSLCLIAASCNGTNIKKEEPDIKEIRDAVADTYGEKYTALNSGTIEELASILSLDENVIEDYFYNTPLMSVNADVFIGIKAKNGKADDVEKAINNYKDYLINDSMQYPMNLAKVSSTTVSRYGNYIFLVMLGDPGADIEDETEALEHCRQQNRIATDKIASFFN